MYRQGNRKRQVNRTAVLGITLLVIFSYYILKSSGISELNWGFISILILSIGLLFLYRWAQLLAVSTKELTLIATLIAVAALGRVPFAVIPGVQPTTFIIMMAACVFGPQAGFMVGAGAALLSNFFLGQGPWTPWQMLAWGLLGISTAYFYRLRVAKRIGVLAAFGFIWGFIFGGIMNIHFWLVFVYPLSLATYLATCVTSFYFDLFHAAGNCILIMVLSRPVIKILEDYKRKIKVLYLEQDTDV